MPNYVPTNAASSGVKLDKKTLKAIAARTDRPGLIWLGQWVICLALTGALVMMSLGTFWVWPAMLLHGVCLTVPAYAASHETAHGTAFRTRWLNEAVLWVTSLLYMEEPLHRRFTHTNHHTAPYTHRAACAACVLACLRCVRWCVLFSWLLLRVLADFRGGRIDTRAIARGERSVDGRVAVSRALTHAAVAVLRERPGRPQ